MVPGVSETSRRLQARSTPIARKARFDQSKEVFIQNIIHALARIGNSDGDGVKLDTPRRDLAQVGRFRDRVNSCSGHCWYQWSRLPLVPICVVLLVARLNAKSSFLRERIPIRTGRCMSAQSGHLILY